MILGKKIPYLALAFVFAALWLILLLVTPPERTLGTIIRWVFAHGSLTQAAVYVFLIAAFLAAGYLLGNEKLYLWMITVGAIAFFLWILGFIVSVIPARMAWGVFVDFNEPRTQMTLRVLAVGAIFLVIVWWVNNPKFSAIAILLFAFILLFLVRSTSLIRHPANPVGDSPSSSLQLVYAGILFSAILASLSAAGYLVERHQQEP